MGMWGAAQAIAFGAGGFAGTVAADLARQLVTAPGLAYALVFAAEAVLFVGAAVLAVRAIGSPRPTAGPRVEPGLQPDKGQRVAVDAPAVMQLQKG
jgi:BCD family chlorophyll transporter-like MFS transporter